jgi:Zinc finger C-x8-C-x5-C-x3-H type (and similar)
MMGGQSTCISLVFTLRMLNYFLGEVCHRFMDGVCQDGDDCPYAHPEEGTLSFCLALLL